MNNTLDKQYTDLLQDILDNGVTKQDRTGTGTISVFGRQIRHKMSEGFPLLTTKKIAFKTMVTELLWFLRGDTNIKFLVDNGCHIWDGDAFKRYADSHTTFKDGFAHTQPIAYSKEEFINKIKTDDDFAEKWGSLGSIYGKQWRKWFHGNWWMNGSRPMVEANHIDQIANLINDLKINPDSRRLMVNSWNVGELDQMVLPPCHYGFQVYTRELSMSEKELWYKNNNINPNEPWYPNFPTRAISLMWNQRSVDTFLGLPFNIASYGLLLEIIAKEVNMVPDELIGNLGDVHLYSNHIEQAKEQIGRELTIEERKQIFEDRGYVCDVWPFNGDWSGEYDGFGIPKRTREPFPLPTLKIEGTEPSIIDKTKYWKPEDFQLINYQSHPSIKALLSN